jgi:hypothetical protein
MMKCSNQIFWPESQRRVHCHDAKLEPESVGNNQPGPLVSINMQGDF